MVAQGAVPRSNCSPASYVPYHPAQSPYYGQQMAHQYYDHQHQQQQFQPPPAFNQGQPNTPINHCAPNTPPPPLQNNGQYGFAGPWSSPMASTWPQQQYHLPNPQFSGSTMQPVPHQHPQHQFITSPVPPPQWPSPADAANGQPQYALPASRDDVNVHLAAQQAEAQMPPAALHPESECNSATPVNANQQPLMPGIGDCVNGLVGTAVPEANPYVCVAGPHAVRITRPQPADAAGGTLDSAAEQPPPPPPPQQPLPSAMQRPPALAAGDLRVQDVRTVEFELQLRQSHERSLALEAQVKSLTQHVERLVVTTQGPAVLPVGDEQPAVSEADEFKEALRLKHNLTRWTRLLRGWRVIRRQPFITDAQIKKLTEIRRHENPNFTAQRFRNMWQRMLCEHGLVMPRYSGNAARRSVQPKFPNLDDLDDAEDEQQIGEDDDVGENEHREYEEPSFEPPPGFQGTAPADTSQSDSAAGRDGQVPRAPRVTARTLHDSGTSTMTYSSELPRRSPSSRATSPSASRP